MKWQQDTDYERGFNTAYYLHEFAPAILERAISGLDNVPSEFLKGLKAGRDRRKSEQERESKEAERNEKIEYNRYWTAQRISEEAYKDRVKRAAEMKKQQNQDLEREIKKDFDTDHVQRRLRELEALRNDSGKEPLQVRQEEKGERTGTKDAAPPVLEGKESYSAREKDSMPDKCTEDGKAQQLQEDRELSSKGPQGRSR